MVQNHCRFPMASDHQQQPVKKKPRCSEDDDQLLAAVDVIDESPHIRRMSEDEPNFVVGSGGVSQNGIRCDSRSAATREETANAATAAVISDNEALQLDMDELQTHLIAQCLCGAPILTTNLTALNAWDTPTLLKFLSILQLLFDVYLKQNNKGLICARIVQVCTDLVRNEHGLIEQVLQLCESRDRYINFMATRVLSTFLIVAKANVKAEWLTTITDYLTVDSGDFVETNCALGIVRSVVDWKDVDIHVLDESQVLSNGGTMSAQPLTSNCTSVSYSDSDSFDTSAVKGLIIKSLEAKWPQLIAKIQYLMSNNRIESVQAQTCIIAFLSLWESTISVRANLSVVDTKPFYAHLESFVGVMLASNTSGTAASNSNTVGNNSTLPPIIWKQLLSLFNEVLCYGSTLALQDMLPEDTCQLAHLIVRYVKDYRLLDGLPYRCRDGTTINSFVGSTTTVPSSGSHSDNSGNSSIVVDRTLLQRMVLLVLKSIAITVKETRSDSSDSSVGSSEDYDFFQDMQLIVRSIRDVLRKVDVFIKTSLEYHPETVFAKVLVNLFSDQDDYMIEAMVCTLDITTGISYQSSSGGGGGGQPDFLPMLNPVHSFIELLRTVGHDSDVLLDYLVSNETCFLLYLLRFLKYARKNWDKFVNSCTEESSGRLNELDNTLAVLQRLKVQITRLVTKDLFPYNINPILRLLQDCVNLYEGNDFSS